MRQMRLVKYTPKVRGNDLVSVATLTTWNLASTHSTDVFYAEESDTDEEDRDSVAGRPSSEDVGEPVGDAIATIRAEISELDTIGFDETLELDVSVDISYIIDS
jgi:hypothetical protein